jgi:hypothetical protein
MIINIQAGCLLPALILLNLFFGWMFLKTSTWLVLEGILILLLVLNSYFLIRKVKRWSVPAPGNIIDVHGEVVDEKRELKKEG